MPGGFYIEGRKKDETTQETTVIHNEVTNLQNSVTEVTNRVSTVENFLTNTNYAQSIINNILASIAGHIDFWSAQEPKIIITGAVANPDFPWVVVSGLPSGVEVIRVIAMLKLRAIKDTSGADNYLKQNATIAVMLSGGSWGVDDMPAIGLFEDQWYTVGGVKENGDVMIGGSDIKDVVAGSGTYLFRGDDIAALGNNLELYDVQMGLRVYFRKTPLERPGWEAPPVGVQTQLASIMAHLIVAWAYNPTTGVWYVYDPSALPAENDLDAYRYGWVVWIKVSAACTLSYNGFTVNLAEGWNEFTWKAGG